MVHALQYHMNFRIGTIIGALHMEDILQRCSLVPKRPNDSVLLIATRTQSVDQTFYSLFPTNIERHYVPQTMIFVRGDLSHVHLDASMSFLTLLARFAFITFRHCTRSFMFMCSYYF